MLRIQHFNPSHWKRKAEPTGLRALTNDWIPHPSASNTRAPPSPPPPQVPTRWKLRPRNIWKISVLVQDTQPFTKAGWVCWHGLTWQVWLRCSSGEFSVFPECISSFSQNTPAPLLSRLTSLHFPVSYLLDWKACEGGATYLSCLLLHVQHLPYKHILNDYLLNDECAKPDKGESEVSKSESH